MCQIRLQYDGLERFLFPQLGNLRCLPREIPDRTTELISFSGIDVIGIVPGRAVSPIVSLETLKYKSVFPDSPDLRKSTVAKIERL